eukprot:1148453_1
MVSCLDDDGELHHVLEWRFNNIWWYCTILICTSFTLYVLYDFIIKKSRRTPSKLMLGRMISNYCQLLVFMLTAEYGVTYCSDAITCDILGALFTIFLLISASYYTVICFDLYFTLKNPFRQPASNSMWIHFFVLCFACLITIPIGSAQAFEYREDFQFCWTVYKEGFNFWNLFIVYVPAAGVIIGGIAVTYWSLKGLNARILDDTFELRWKVIKRQTAIVGCITINYVIQGIVWVFTFVQHEPTPTRTPPQPYLLSVFVICGVLFDLIAWCAKDSVLICWKANAIGSRFNLLDESDACMDSMVRTPEPESVRTQTESFFVDLRDHNQPLAYNTMNNTTSRPVTARTQLLNEKYSSENKTENEIKTTKKMAQQQNLSNALRREVITFITAGLVQCIKVTAWETNKRSTQIGGTYDEDFQNDTHPALYIFKDSAPPSGLYQTGTAFAQIGKGRRRRRTYRKKGDHLTADSLSDGGNRRGSYNYHARLGKHSTVAVSIPCAMRYEVKDIDEQHDTDEEFTDTRTVDDDGDDSSSSSNRTPSVSTEAESHSTNEAIVMDNHLGDVSTAGGSTGDETWNGEDATLEFDVGMGDGAMYSASLFATDEAEPPVTYYPQSIKVNAATKKNTGTVNRFNIGIAGSDKVSFTDYAPHVFRYLRTKIYGVVDRSYLESILPMKFGGAITRVSEDIIANFSEGRSGAFFFFTPDNKYLIKTLTKKEAQLLINTLSDYVEYMTKHQKVSFLTKYYGLHSVKLYSKVIYFMVSGNVFPSDKGLSNQIKERYDIKGSWIDRHTNRHLFENKLMKDEDLHRKLRLDPIVSSTIHTQLANDTLFLQRQHIMDYSLLLGISYQQITNKNQDTPNGNTNYEVKANIVEGPGVYYIGLIDMLQKWNKQKAGERFVKVYFRCKNQAGISCVEPIFYRRRFLKKMQKMGL